MRRLTNARRRLFCLNGFGYSVDSQILLVQSIIATKAGYEFNPAFKDGLTIAVYVGMLVGALFWGLRYVIMDTRKGYELMHRLART